MISIAAVDFSIGCGRIRIESGRSSTRKQVQGMEGPNSQQKKRTWRNGNFLIIMVPLGASILPAVFLLGAYSHADAYDLLRLKNDTDVPYISDIGNYKPHSSVFTFGLSLGAMFGFWLILVRHIQVEKVYENTGSKANLAASICGSFGILGELIVGSFQLSSHFTIHYLGAFMHFVSIMIFMFIQTFITHRNIPSLGVKEIIWGQSKKSIYISKLNRKSLTILAYFRGLLSILLLVSVLIFAVFLLPSLSKYNRTGYSVAQIAEWFMFVFVILFMLSFLYDFKDLTCSVHVDYVGSTVVKDKTAGDNEDRHWALTAYL